MTTEILPRHGPDAIASALGKDDFGVPAVAGVVLASGTSSRFGTENKLLAELDGEPLIRHATRTILDAGLATIVVLGHEAPAVRAALAEFDGQFVENRDYRERQPTTDQLLVSFGGRALW
ncbi:nucleotidyltransferase family protein [Natrinema salifodinae]|uniref:Molybdenum cofactor cytidylyltransferase n=1 Tax=Natrinema salifodinae TaxID=1202768 RepID=A0A1I0QS25_9EURY|nr:NTP transferase domain-containing protein [Natrinema salifodinae]SEW30389.1 molybdenum cofactor cytidylyltransferase [Natrinema salifodinae]